MQRFSLTIRGRMRPMIYCSTNWPIVLSRSWPPTRSQSEPKMSSFTWTMPIATKILCPPTAPRMWSLFGLLLKSTTKPVFSKPRCPVGSRSALCPMNRNLGRGRGIRGYFVNFVRRTLNTCVIRSSLQRRKPALIPTILALPLGASSYEIWIEEPLQSRWVHIPCLHSNLCANACICGSSLCWSCQASAKQWLEGPKDRERSRAPAK